MLERLAAALADRYRIEREIGAGGMATVYLAHDLKHDRDVAIKVLHPDLGAALGSERFLSEIRTTARLQHPHILPLLDSGSAQGPDMSGPYLYYVMPLVAGETLRSRLERERQLPVEDAVLIAREVADALGYAHGLNVIHRDIKPENILLQGGHALVADFGIALAVQSAGGARMTQTGLSLGTPQYMSPEQAMGEKQIDARSDIYALGAVTYEMLTGDAPFTGSSVQAIVAKIMTEKPTPVHTLRDTVPEHVEEAVLTALAKLPADRFESAKAFAEALAGSAPRSRRAASTRRGSRALALGALALGILALALGVGIGRVLAPARHQEVTSPRHWNVVLPAYAPLALTGSGPLGIWQLALALAPAGDRLAYLAPSNGTTMIAVRPLDRDSSVILPGTEGAYYPFFSPDGSWIGYFVGAELRKIPVAGGTPITVATVERPVGAVWRTADEIILFQMDGFQVRRISASGGRDSTLALRSQFGAPSMLPGSDWIVGHLGSGQLALFSLEKDSVLAITRRGVLPPDSVQISDMLVGFSPHYVASGHLVFGTGDGILMALPFDPDTREVRGSSVPVLDGVRIEEGFGFAQFAIGPDGTLIFVPGRSQLHGNIAFIQPDGTLDTFPLPRGQYTQPRMSPDGTRLAVQVTKPAGGWDILIADLDGGITQRVAVVGNYRAYPGSWTPDGRELMVGLFRPAGNSFLGARMYTIANRTWTDLPPLDGSYMTIAPDGETFVYSNFRTGAIFLRSLLGDTTSIPVSARGTAASFSPDGKWLSWGGADGGVAVSPVPPTGVIFPVAERGQQPIWMPDGRHLIYRDGRRFFEVSIELGGGFHTGKPRLIAEGPFIRTFAWNHTISKSGRLVVMVALPGNDTRVLGVIAGFARDLARQTPARPQ
ncbi:MAG: protein kinase [Gemmatimonadota bacterium]